VIFRVHEQQSSREIYSRRTRIGRQPTFLYLHWNNALYEKNDPTMRGSVINAVEHTGKEKHSISPCLIIPP
jgi:hypothetical protein